MRSRLIEVFKELRKEGFLARANFMCCRNCAGSELACRAEKLYEKGKEVKGAIFWTRQDEESLRNHSRMYIAYGPCVTQKYGTIGLSTKEVGKKLCEKLDAYHIPYRWNGDPNVRILVGENIDQEV
ncbi:hypothetical protein J7J18_01770 [bacterium]|nr:hypothetical protein [bacterium]